MITIEDIKIVEMLGEVIGKKDPVLYLEEKNGSWIYEINSNGEMLERGNLGELSQLERIKEFCEREEIPIIIKD